MVLAALPDLLMGASFEKRVGGNGSSSPSSPSNARWNGRRGAGPCQALAAEGGGRRPGFTRAKRPRLRSPPAARWAAVRDHALAPSLLPRATSPIRNSTEPYIRIFASHICDDYV